MVEQLIAPDQIQAFLQRRADVVETAQYYEIDTRQHAIIIGGAGLALYGIDTYVPELSSNFDVDLILKQPERERKGMRAALRRAYGNQVSSEKSEHAPLEATVITGALSEGYSRIHGFEDYDDMVAHVQLIDGLPTLPYDCLMLPKAKRDFMKDRAGILKAHLTSVALGLSVVEYDLWWDFVDEAVQRFRDNIPAKDETSKRAYPTWIAQARTSDFSHPAFHRATAK